MKVLIAEDDFTSRREMNRLLSKYGECDISVDGREAITAFNLALEANDPYDLVCLDILIPELDGYQVLRTIRTMEREKKVPEGKQSMVIMTSELSNDKNVMKASELGCEAYVGKPIDSEKFEKELRKLGLIT